jgi:hypothetical protein
VISRGSGVISSAANVFAPEALFNRLRHVVVWREFLDRFLRRKPLGVERNSAVVTPCSAGLGLEIMPNNYSFSLSF